MHIRKMLTVVEEIYEDGGKKAARPIRVSRKQLR